MQRANCLAIKLIKLSIGQSTTFFYDTLMPDAFACVHSYRIKFKYSIDFRRKTQV